MKIIVWELRLSNQVNSIIGPSHLVLMDVKEKSDELTQFKFCLLSNKTSWDGSKDSAKDTAYFNLLFIY